MPQTQNYDEMSVQELHEKAREMGISGHSSMNKEQLTKAIQQQEKGGKSR